MSFTIHFALEAEDQPAASLFSSIRELEVVSREIRNVVIGVAIQNAAYTLTASREMVRMFYGGQDYETRLLANR